MENEDLYDEFGNYIGPAIDGSDNEDNDSQDHNADHSGSESVRS